MKNRTRLSTGTGLLVALVFHSGAQADEAATPPMPTPPPELPKVEVGPRGIRVTSPDGSHRFEARALFQHDGRFFIEGEGRDTFTVRRLRPTFSGHLYDDFQFRITPELATDQSLLDAWLNWRIQPEFQIQAGIFKAPYGYERLQGAAALSFNERGLPTNLVPARDQGIQIHGGIQPSGINYALAGLNGAQNGDRPNSDTDNNKTVAGRLYWQPSEGALQGLLVGLGGSYGNEKSTAAPPAQRSPGQVAFFTYENDVRADGTRWRLNPHAGYYNGSFGLLAEYVLDSQEVNRGGVDQRVETDAWLVSASWVLTGENASYSGVRPARPFSRGGGWGAWELVARVHGLEVGDDVYAGDPATTRLANPATQFREALAYGVGLNWHANQNVKAYLSVEQTRFRKGDGNRDNELVLFTHTQFSF